jgi:hypothetical protein
MTHRTELFHHDDKLYDIRIEGDAEGYEIAVYDDGRSLGSAIWLPFEKLPGASAETFQWYIEEIVNVQKEYVRNHVSAAGEQR